MLESRSLYGGLFLLAIIATCCTGQTDLCAATDAQISCDNCLAASGDCVWCPYTPCQNSTLNRVTHCYSRTSAFICPEPVVDPPAVVTNTQDANLSNESLTGVESIQVSPQRVRMELRRGSPQSFNMSFIALRNTPLDVYFLLDVSASLVQIFTALRDNLQEIASSIGRISSAYQIGIGGFIDKDVFPYGGTNNYFVKFRNATICRQEGGVCDLPFGYRHYLKLTNDTSKFQDVLDNNITLRVNADSPEGGLDALMQIAVCDDIIGWRESSLKMVFLITDNDFHIAGDGYLAGLVRPNDALCHMERIPMPGFEEQFEYTYSRLQDYPSISQLRTVLERELIVPIFGIQQSQPQDPRILVYENLAAAYPTVQASAIPIVLGSGSTSSTNQTTAELIIDLINNAYEATAQTIQVVTPTIDGYTITVDPLDCPMIIITDEGRRSCRVTLDEIITFKVTVELTDCSAGSQTIQLRGAPYEFSTIDLEPVCTCGCSQTKDNNSECCNDIGTLVCGRCDCNSDVTGRFGYQCECDEPAIACPMFNGTECGGEMRGMCSGCGVCICNPPFFGPENGCRCDDASCNCNGRGSCVCGVPPECACDALAPVSQEPYFGPTCDCNPDICFNTNWTSDGRKAELCQVANNRNNSGMCACTGCQCGQTATGTADLQSGDGLCLPMNLCDFFAPCVSCTISGENCPDLLCSTHPSYLLRRSDEVSDSNTDQYFSNPCNAIVGGCTYEFSVGRPSFAYNLPVLIFEDTMDCGQLPSWAPYTIAAGIVLLIIVLGLLILCLLKIGFVVWDKKEYGKFTAELQHADFAPHENPLYLTPQQDYPNPILRRHSSKRSK
ncbi:integrin beta-1-like [Halichondria panicea]|uniref:integrin beta-1-like n=1 Tax=Halichondria panicea TaxID=6063 RepID=UPI00312B8F3D